MSLIDLHLHSNASDGTYTPKTVMTMARDLGLTAAALTDHDTVSGLCEAMKVEGIEVIPGLEISAADEPDKGLVDIHVLGLLIDVTNKTLNDTLSDRQRSKNIKAREQARMIEASGFALPWDEVLKVSEGDTVRRPHLWSVVKEHNPGAIDIEDFFARTRMGGEWFVDLQSDLTMERCVALIEGAGGIPIIAHPGCYNRRYKEDGTLLDERPIKILDECVKAGIKGIEVYYNYRTASPYYDNGSTISKSQQKELVDHYNNYAKEHDLLVSGGSDFHGTALEWVKMGAANVPYNVLERLKEFKQ